MRKMRVGKNFKQQVKGRAMKLQAKQPALTYDEAKYLVLDEVFSELENGAYFAAMSEQGLSDTKIMKLNDSIAEKGIYI